MPRKVTVADTLEMSPKDRYRLAQDILGSLDDDFVREEERQLIEARLKSYQKDPSTVERWDDVRRELFGK